MPSLDENPAQWFREMIGWTGTEEAAVIRSRVDRSHHGKGGPEPFRPAYFISALLVLTYGRIWAISDLRTNLWGLRRGGIPLDQISSVAWDEGTVTLPIDLLTLTNQLLEHLLPSPESFVPAYEHLDEISREYMSQYIDDKLAWDKEQGRFHLVSS